MYNKTYLEEAMKYLSKYKTIEECILRYGEEYPMSTIILNLYKFREIENLGYDLEDVFMEVYTSILDKQKNGGIKTNMTSFVQRHIINYFKDDFVDMSQRKLNKLNREGIELLELKRKELDLINEEIDDSTSFIDDITDKDFVNYILDKAGLTDKERKILFGHFKEQKSFSELSVRFDTWPQTIGIIINRTLRKLRSTAYSRNYYNYYNLKRKTRE